MGFGDCSFELLPRFSPGRGPQGSLVAWCRNGIRRIAHWRLNSGSPSKAYPHLCVRALPVGIFLSFACFNIILPSGLLWIEGMGSFRLLLIDRRSFLRIFAFLHSSCVWSVTSDRFITVLTIHRRRRNESTVLTINYGESQLNYLNFLAVPLVLFRWSFGRRPEFSVSSSWQVFIIHAYLGMDFLFLHLISCADASNFLLFPKPTSGQVIFLPV